LIDHLLASDELVSNISLRTKPKPDLERGLA
jgi:hypothetical protein